MSWLFSRALVEAFSAATCSAGAQSAPLSGSPTPQAYLPPDRMTAFSRPSRLGMTFAPLTESLGADVLTWCLEASRAKTSALPARGQASPASDPACGPTWRASLAKFDPVSSSWKTVQLSLLGASDESLVTWPRSGMTADGQCWELPTLERPTAANDSGLWPTPTCPNGGRSVAHVTDWRSERTAYNAKGKKVQVDLGQAVKRWPTPTSSLGTNGGLVTPAKAREGGTLIEALSARTYATPTARDWRSGKASQATHDKNSRPLSEQIGGSLNPTWVEWLMGWPLGWTDLEPSVTDKYRHALPKHGDC